ncbi:GNVR domain-containing protein [Pseudoalteromonas haloplanktis]|uniref:GNVR domain-containing protein n=1 Tax=Pseudoalteromonas haloplanktis TaxID=228 RepID=A0ABU1BI35_PSEHA|nr:GNVR domain-containing protein [Pseudoalteromonas haloplanktis]MDQ9094144.1 GNVR domain-containing protein [Pseudoalteromonas haloplanktis]
MGYKKNILTYNKNLYDESNDNWVRVVELPRKAKPSMQEAYKEFIQIVSTNNDIDTGMVKISIEHISPYIAKQWLSWLVEDINKEMKNRDVTEAIRSTEFLTSQLSQTTITDIQSVLYKLIEEQAKTIMFANVRDEYVFKTIDPALIPEEKSRPKRPLIVILGTMLGGLIGVMVILIRHFYRSN